MGFHVSPSGFRRPFENYSVEKHNAKDNMYPKYRRLL